MAQLRMGASKVRFIIVQTTKNADFALNVPAQTQMKGFCPTP
jgi:hypothetical protein